MFPPRNRHSRDSYGGNHRVHAGEDVIWGADGCTTAELAGADYDAASGELAVAVATRREADSGDVACTEAIVDIDYEAAVTFENGLPARVVVTHTRGETSVEVTTVER